MIRNLIIVVFALMMFGCGDGNKNKTTHVTEYNLKHKFHKELFFNAPKLAVMGDYLIISDIYQRDSICRLYAIDKGMEEVAAYGNIGNGPGEFIQPALTYAGEDEFFMNEVNHSLLAVIGIVEEGGQVQLKEKERLKGVYKPKKGEIVPRDLFYTPLGSNHYVSLIEAGEDRYFNLLDSTLAPITSFGELPIKEKLDPMVVRNRLQGKIAVHGETLFVGTTKLPYLASYTLRQGSMEKDWSVFYETPHYSISNGDVKFSREHSKGPLLSLRADSRYIYLLYVDKLLWESETGDIPRCTNKVFIFNHQGEKVACLNLDCSLSLMEIDMKRNKIYGVAHVPDYALVEFDLPKDMFQ